MAAPLPEFMGVTARSGESTGIVTYDFPWGRIFYPEPEHQFFRKPWIGFAINYVGKDAGLWDIISIVKLKYQTYKEVEEDNIWYSYDCEDTPENISKLQQIAMMAVNAGKIAERKKNERYEAWEKRDKAEAVLQQGITESMTTFNLMKYANMRGYPYYLAQYQESRLQGAYPAGVKGIRALEKMVDKSVGLAHRELKSENIQDLLSQLKQKGIDPAYDNVHFYMVRSPGSPREGIQYQRLLAMMREANGIKEKKYATGPFSTYPFSQDLSFATDEDMARALKHRDETSRRNDSNFRKHKETCEVCQNGYITHEYCEEGWGLMRGKASGLKPGEKGEAL